MKLRSLWDLKQLFKYKYLDLWGWTENRSLGYRVQHGEDAEGWRQKAFGWGRATREDTSFQNKGSCPYCERLMASLVNTDSTRDHPVVWRVLWPLLQSSPTPLPHPQGLSWHFWSHCFQPGPLVAGMSSYHCLSPRLLHLMLLPCLNASKESSALWDKI